MGDAWKILVDWAKSRGILKPSQRGRVEAAPVLSSSPRARPAKMKTAMEGKNEGP